MKPLVSICMPTLNARAYLEPRVDSILAQTCRDWEVIVCDSHSTDGTMDFLKKFSGDPRWRLYDVPREGLYAGWNECLRRATGEWIYIATADDTCSPEFLAQMLAAYERAKSAAPDMRFGMVSCDFDYIRSDGSVIDSPPGPRPSDVLGDWRKTLHARSRWVDLLMTLSVAISWGPYTALMFRRELLESAGFFRTDCGAAADRLWAARSVLNADMVWEPRRLATWRKHTTQASGALPLWVVHKIALETRRFLVESAGRLPDEWRRHEDWLERLSWGAWQAYHLALALDRSALRALPRRFAKGTWHALLHDPMYLARRLGTGLKWGKDDYRDGSEQWRKLMDDFGVPWPPIPLTA